ncbi:MAG: SDR family oxidoreductase [Chloroflexota bacterium]|nr:SDR family oxidoreductase [Chloroflexota bacterium]
MAQTDLTGKSIVVTGATQGIGYVAARDLAGMGAAVTLAGRDPARVNVSVDQIRRETGATAVDGLVADLSSMAGVHELADAYLARHDRLDVLLNNAGAWFTTRQTTVDGYERTFALNHLAPFLLTHLLLDVLTASGPARIITVASMAHNGQRLNLDDVNNASRPYQGLRVYGESKLANIMFTYALARRLSGTGVTANTLHPGLVSTGFGKNNGAAMRWLMALYALVAISPEKGAQTSIYLASSPEVADVTGKYFIKEKPARSSAVSYDEQAQERLWAISEQMTGVVPAALR